MKLNKAYLKALIKKHLEGKNLFIAGVDPAKVKPCGFALVALTADGSMIPMYAKTLEHLKGDKVARLVSVVSEGLKDKPIDGLIVEVTRYSAKYMNVFGATNWSSGVFEGIFQEHFPKIKCFHIQPSSWRKILGNGRMSKDDAVLIFDNDAKYYSGKGYLIDRSPDAAEAYCIAKALCLKISRREFDD